MLRGPVIASTPMSIGGKTKRIGAVSITRTWITSALALITAAWAPAALADNDKCYASYESAQQLRNKGELVAAREELRVCADPSCPAAVTGDCGPWLAAVEGSIPTVTFVVKDEKGGDLEDVLVKMDGKDIVSKLDGKAVPLNPGVHTFTFSAEGRMSEEKKVTVHEGEKARTIDVTLNPTGGGTGGKAGEGTKGKNLAVPFGVTVGVGVVGLGLWGVFGGLGLAEKSDAETTCAPNCTDDDLSGIKTKFLVADISMGVGLASAVGAAIVGIVWATGSTTCDLATDKDCKPVEKKDAALVIRSVGVAPLQEGGGVFVFGGGF